jgi:uncharacterized SAM-binding protein YcdF (DUF218 family)
MQKKLIITTLIIITALILFRTSWLGYLGQKLIIDNPAEKADVAIVLTTGADYLPRLLQAAKLYRDKRVPRILINGNRKTDAIRKLEQQGFISECKWYENSVQILSMYGVPRNAIWTISAEDVFDSVSEAQVIKPFLTKQNVSKLIITTSKFHTRRSRYVWQKVMGKNYSISTSAAAEDPFDPNNWWNDGRQIKQVMGEYGSMAYYLWKQPWK